MKWRIKERARVERARGKKVYFDSRGKKVYFDSRRLWVEGREWRWRKEEGI